MTTIIVGVTGSDFSLWVLKPHTCASTVVEFLLHLSTYNSTCSQHVTPFAFSLERVVSGWVIE